MKTISCPWCDSSLPHTISTEACPTCGRLLHSVTSTVSQSSETSERDPEVATNSSSQGTRSHPHRDLFTFSRFSQLQKGFLLSRLRNIHRSQKQGARRFAERRAFSIPLTLEDEKPFTGSLPDQASEENDLSNIRPNGQLTWQKVIIPSPQKQSHIYPPRPPEPEGERVGATDAAHLSQSSSTLQAFKRSTVSRFRHSSPKTMFWISTAILLIIISLFGIASSFGQRQLSTTNIDNRLSLQITPNELSVGATMTLRGDHFSPNASIGLTRDNAIPLIDTFGGLFIQADPMGHFTDTIFVGKDWGIGSHMIMAEDSVQHQVASFPIMVDGQGTSLRPPHFHLSANALDFGKDDQATNTTKTLTLLNGVGNENGESSAITWQGSTSDSWLLITPTQGTFISAIPQQVTVAVDRSKLQPGSYTAQVHFSSNGGDESLAVAMQVELLKPEHDAIMQVSPTLLSFTMADGNSTTISQQLTISNSGGQTMNWHASADKPWLTVSSPSLQVASGGSTTAQVSVTSRNMLPGIYTGKLTFTAQNSSGKGTAFHSPQEVVVSLTITPACTLQVTSGIVNFSSAYLQSAPTSKTIDITASAGCTRALPWDAQSDANWLTLNNAHGTTPSTLSIGVNTSALTPNTYKGNVTISSPAGTQTVVVALTLGPADGAAISTSPSSLSFNSVAGQGVPDAKTITLTNTGEGVLTWQANAKSNQNRDWFQVSPANGTLAAHQTTTLTVTVTSSRPLASRDYNGAIVLSGTSGAGQRATGSPQRIPISYTVTAPPPTLQVTIPPSISIKTPGTISSPINLTNTGGSALNWSAALQSGTPAFVTLSTTSGSNLLGGAVASTNLVVNTNGVANGQYQTNVNVSATNATNGQPVTGSQATIPITIIIPSPVMQVSRTNIAFSALTGNTVKSELLTITNSGGATLSWTVSSPTNSWLSISTTSGNTPKGTSSQLVFSVDTKGLTASTTPYTDQVVITPSVGNPVTINLSLMVTDPRPKPTPPPTVAPTPGTTTTPIPTSTTTTTPIPTASAVPTPVPTINPSPTPVSTNNASSTPILSLKSNFVPS